MEDKSVTVIVKHRITKEKEELLKEWIKGISAASSKCEGHLGVKTTSKIIEDEIEYVLIFRFENYEKLEKWENSEIRMEWIRKLEIFSDHTADITRIENLMLWFNTPKANSYQPPKYKIAVIIWCSVFPLQLIMPKILLPLAVLPKLPALFISSVIMVTLLNYLVMPFMMKLFSRWLIKK